MRRKVVGFAIIVAMALACWLWLRARPVQMLPISCQIAANPPEGEFVSERFEIRNLAFADLDGDGLQDKVVVDEKFISPVKAKALLRIYWGDRRGRETLGEVVYLSWSILRKPLLFLADLDGDGQKEIVSFMDAPNYRLALKAWAFDRQQKRVRQVSQIVTDAPFGTDRTEVVDLGRDRREEIATFDWGWETGWGLKGFLTLARGKATVWVFGWDEQKRWWQKKATFKSKGRIIVPVSIAPMRVMPILRMMHLRTPSADFFAIPVEVEESRWNWQGLCFVPDWQYFTLLLQANSPDPSRWRLVTEIEGKPMKTADLDGDGIEELIAFDKGSFSLVRVSKGKVEVATLRGKGVPEVLIPRQPNGQIFVRWERSQWQRVSLQ
jgi:hypothetical protein